MRSRPITLLLAAVAICCSSLVAPVASASTGPKVTRLVLGNSSAYQPKAQPGTTDDYHCTLLDPHVRHDSFITSSQFKPGSLEDHHAALFLVPPTIAAAARRHHQINTGWTCFGEAALPGTTLAQFLKNPFLSEWAPGHGADRLPQGTGIRLPKGSLVIIQVHYNLLVGHRPVRNTLVLDTVPANSDLEPLTINLALAPPDIPCPEGVTGPLCSEPAALANLGVRFGPDAVMQATGIERLCGEDPANPPISTTARCITKASRTGWIVRTQAHMHLLGTGFSMVLDPGTPQAKTVLSVPHYSFDDQRAYNLARPIHVVKGQPLEITCTYDPNLSRRLPLLRKTSPHLVTWGDGSTDEMCIGLAWVAPSLPRTRHRS